MEKKKRNIDPSNKPGPKGCKDKVLNLLCTEDFYYRVENTAKRLKVSKAEILRSCFDTYFFNQRDKSFMRTNELMKLKSDYEAGKMTVQEYYDRADVIDRKDY